MEDEDQREEHGPLVQAHADRGPDQTPMQHVHGKVAACRINSSSNAARDDDWPDDTAPLQQLP